MQTTSHDINNTDQHAGVVRDLGQQNRTLFTIYVAYRTLVSVVLLLMLISPKSRELIGALNPTLYLLTALIYCASNIALVALLPKQIHTHSSQLFFVFFTDIICLTIMADTSQGMTSGLPALLIVSVAASAVLEKNRTIATLIAALAVIAVLSDTLRLIAIDIVGFNNLLASGLLGMLLFSVSVLVQVVAQRLRRAEGLARDRAFDLYNLQRLNEHIVQQLKTGILLVDDNDLARPINNAAGNLLSPQRPLPPRQQRPLASTNESLAAQYQQWKQQGKWQGTPFYAPNSDAPLVAHFSKMGQGDGQPTLVFVEDYTPATQYAQSLKLNSLGRLTASIAHEIRNPLGAASHAAQLLAESNELSPSDRHLSDIVQKHCERMNIIIESVMQISRREPPKMQYLKLGQWLENTIKVYQDARTHPADITLHCAFDELEIEFDPENLERIMTNLLDNALRHSHLACEHEIAEVYVHLDMQAQHCMIEVIDRGQGVAPADQGKLFEPFFTTVKEGSGLGLFLCKELCDINHADLRYRTTEDGYGCFSIHLTKRS